MMIDKSPLNNVSAMPLCITLKVDGTVIKDSYGIASININHSINLISVADIQLRGNVDIGNNRMPLTDDDDFIPGKSIEITAGYGDGGETSIFKGIIVKHSLEISADVGYIFKLTCKHAAVKMTFNQKEELFKDKTDDSIIKLILSDYSLNCNVDSCSIQNEMVFQKLATDWDFVLARAEFNGFVITMDKDSMNIGKPRFNEPAVLNIAIGDSLISFDAELNGENQPASLETTSWDPKTQAMLKSTAEEPSLNEQGTIAAKDLPSKLPQSKLSINTAVPMSTDELKSWADASLLSKRMNAVKGQVKFIGNGEVKTGDIIELMGVGKKFSGKAYVSQVTHSFDNGSWNTVVKFGLDYAPVSRKTDFSYPPALGQIPAIQGLQIATVKQLISDPASKYRILLDFPTNATNATGVWARMATFYASSEFGASFYPSVGDEVIVGFLENDPRHPIVLGAVYSEANKPPAFPLDDNNYVKSIITKTKLSLSFDDEKKIIQIKTPGGNSVILSDDAKSIELKDQNNNIIKMANDGITISSDKDINIKAQGNIVLNGVGKVTVSAKQDAVISGANINATAEIGFTAKGNASAEISASGQTIVKGAIVMIN